VPCDPTTSSASRASRFRCAVSCYAAAPKKFRAIRLRAHDTRPLAAVDPTGFGRSREKGLVRAAPNDVGKLDWKPRRDVRVRESSLSASTWSRIDAAPADTNHRVRVINLNWRSLYAGRRRTFNLCRGHRRCRREHVPNLCRNRIFFTDKTKITIVTAARVHWGLWRAGGYHVVSLSSLRRLKHGRVHVRRRRTFARPQLRTKRRSRRKPFENPLPGT